MTHVPNEAQGRPLRARRQVEPRAPICISWKASGEKAHLKTWDRMRLAVMKTFGDQEAAVGSQELGDDEKSLLLTNK